MKLIPRKKQQLEPTALEKAAMYAKLGARGLTAQRVARKGHRNLRFTKRAITIAGLGAIFAAVLKKAKGAGAPSTPAYTPPPAPTGPSAGTSATASTGTPPLSGSGNGNGTAASGPEVTDALADAGVEGSGPDTPEEAATDTSPSSDATVEFLPPVDAPNPGTPPPPKRK